MSQTYTGLLAVLCLSVLTSGAGLWIASKKPSWYTQERLYFLASISTGLLLSLISFVLLPHSFEHYSLATSISLILGFLSILFVETYISPKLDFLEGNSCDHDHSKEHDHKHSPTEEHHHHFISHQAACSAVGCLIVCAFFDGFQIQTAFSLGSKAGWITLFGLLFHILPDGVLASTIALSGGMNRRGAIIVSLCTGGVLFLGALLSIGIKQFSNAEHYLHPFTTGILIYVTLTHLLPMGTKHKWGIITMSVTAALYILGQSFIY